MYTSTITEGKKMSIYLSNTMPELTDQEISWKGMYTVSYYDDKVKSLVAAKCQSIQSFLDHNGLTESALGIIQPIFDNTGKFEMLTEHGYVGIYQQGLKY